MTEKTASDAPAWYSADEASAWADGYNACLAAQPQSPWQPIDTAPRDGRRILLCWDDSDTLSAHVELGKRKAFAWANTYGNPFAGEPTHWMPLPDSPISRPDRNTGEA